MLCDWRVCGKDVSKTVVSDVIDHSNLMIVETEVQSVHSIPHRDSTDLLYECWCSPVECTAYVSIFADGEGLSWRRTTGRVTVGDWDLESLNNALWRSVTKQGYKGFH